MASWVILGYIYCDDDGGNPDLRVSELTINKLDGDSAQPLALNPGEQFQITVEITNKGDGDVNDKFYIKYLISDDKVFDSHDEGISDETGDDDDSIPSLGADDPPDEEEIIVNAPDDPGTYYIGVWADYKDDIDEEDESNNFSDSDDEIGAIIVEIPNEKPIGYVDAVDCNYVKGWAKDPDTTDPISVHIYADGPAESVFFVGSTIANSYRGDISYTDKNHGFSFAIPNSLKDNQIHSIYVYAIDSEGGENPLLDNSPQNLQCVPVAAIMSIINELILAEKDTGPIKPGDLNGDGLITLSDAILALQVSCGMSFSVKIEADINNDGKIGMAEAIYIFQII